jgi:hypothetical protein
MATDEPVAGGGEPVAEAPGSAAADSPVAQQADAAPGDEPMFKPPEMEAVVASLKSSHDQA